jgi:hypothetical protein
LRDTRPSLLSDLLDEEQVGDDEDEEDQQQQLASTSSSSSSSDKDDVDRTDTPDDVKLKCKDESETVINVGLKKVSA